ncbi:MlaD family protein [Nocardia cyriacigeorgica]|uniref:MlaD family protein n=1 Tax=Nocardia cyriacigeorgica TaxID=135487 RepID=UPI0024928D8E|nr:MCE family protein [Nocardia cyriacigeorgica]BDU05164.1 putative Mce family protein [Nocardia cyriacigeorgica]
MPALNIRGRMRRILTGRDETSVRYREFGLGALGAAGVALVLLIATALYVIPFGRTTYTAELLEAETVQTGDEVRLAGLTVGEVESLELRPDKVIMRFSVDSEVFLGAQTSLDVRMLTLVGGHYVALFPAGEQPLGDNVIPPERVRLPYSLMQTFQDAAEPVRAVDGTTLRANLSAFADALAAAPDSLRRMLDGTEDLIDVLNAQRSDVSEAIAVAAEYLGVIDLGKGQLRRMIDKINLLETMLIDKRAEVREAVVLLRSVFGRIGALQPSWEHTLKPMAQQLADAIDELEQIGQRLAPLVDSVHSIGQQLQQMVLPDGSVQLGDPNATLTAEGPVDPAVVFGQFCIPVPGKAC